MCAVLDKTSETIVRASLQVWYMRRVSSLRAADAWLSSMRRFCKQGREKGNSDKVTGDA